MESYKRLLSYIYLYEQGKKIRNVGFIKVEKKQGTCRFFIQIKGNRLMENQECPVYLFYMKGKDACGILIGNILFIKGIGQLRCETAADDLMQSGHGFDEVKGLMILAGEGVVLGTRWDLESQLPDKMMLESAKEEIPEHKSECCLLWENIRKNKQEIRLFESHESERYISVSPRELLIIPKIGRVLCNNSFLLHGFYNYGHIILGYHELLDQLVIGVPGTYSAEEKRLAQLFGYASFRAKQISKEYNEKEGYWIRNAKLP